MPKIYHDERNGTYYLVSSTCNRLDERQPDSEVEKTIRLHSSSCLDGPWRPWSDGCSAVPGLDGMFKMTVLEADFERQRLLCIAPYTDAAGNDRSRTLPPCFHINLAPVEVLFRVRTADPAMVCHSTAVRRTIRLSARSGNRLAPVAECWQQGLVVRRQRWILVQSNLEITVYR